MNFILEPFLIDLIIAVYYFSVDDFNKLEETLTSLTNKELNLLNKKGYFEFISGKKTFRIYFKDSGNFLRLYNIEEIIQ